MTNRTSIITLAAIAITGAAAIATPSHAQLGGAVGGSAGGAVGGVSGSAHGAAGAATTPPSANGNTGINGTVGVPNVTSPTDSVRQGAAGINSAQAEATRTTGNAAQDAQARTENEAARTGVTPNANAGINAPGLNANANANADAPSVANETARTANSAANRGATTAGNAANRTEQEVTRQLNTDANASASGNLSTR